MKAFRYLFVAVAIAALPFSASAQVQPTTQMTSDQIVAPLPMETARQLVNYVRLNGYTCNRPDLVRQCLLSRCFEVRCDVRWTYELTQNARGGIDIAVK
ncbi:hypothetical protein [Niveispirillum sp. KHB5.9]|uniref:hypothetical protein n=1 Tax=Niveispirillum sp. KHB5.9 TaxID=3400269 RepID=UPI003A8A3A0A